MRLFYSYCRLFIASWMFMAGVSVQFIPTAAAMARDIRWRERQLQAVPVEQRAKWIEDKDDQDANYQAYLRLFGVLIGGLGLAAALRETAYLLGRYGR